MKNDFFLIVLDIFIDYYLILLENCIFYLLCGLDVIFVNMVYVKIIKMIVFILFLG